MLLLPFYHLCVVCYVDCMGFLQAKAEDFSSSRPSFVNPLGVGTSLLHHALLYYLCFRFSQFVMMWQCFFFISKCANIGSLEKSCIEDHFNAQLNNQPSVSNTSNPSKLGIAKIIYYFYYFLCKKLKITSVLEGK